MNPNRAARIAAIILAIVGLALIFAAFVTATRQFTVTVRTRPQATATFKCGSVLFPKDPRNRVGNRANVPIGLRRAYTRCQKKSNEQSHKAITFLVIGVIPLLIVLTLPALSRRSRRARSRRRVKF